MVILTKFFYGKDALKDFIQWLLEQSHCTMIAHNFGEYDSYFVLKGLTDEGICPVIIPRGGRILSLSLPGREIKFLDSYLFVPLPLRKLPDCFGIPTQKKGGFPHLMKRPEFQDYNGSMPPMHLWNPKQMSLKQRI